MAESRRVSSSLITLGIVLSAFATVGSAATVSLPLRLEPHVLLASTDAEETTLFSDNFNDGDAQGWTAHQGDWQVINGEYVYGANGITEIDGVTVAGDQSWENYVYESKFKLIEGGPQIYFLFRFTDYYNYERYDGYSFQIDTNDKWYIYKWYTETRIPTVIAESSYSTITPGEWYTMRVEVLGAHIKCYVNGELKLDTQDSSYPRGRIGFRGDGCKLAFDDVRVYTTKVASTNIAISPASFTVDSGQTQTLTATLRDENNNPLTDKPISWSTTAGSLSATSSTTNSSGQVLVTFTAPSVTTQTPATISASFAGDSDYKSSSGTSSVTITVTTPGMLSTTLSISPSSFTLQSGVSTTLTATLKDNNNSPLANKTIGWSTTAGSLSATSSTTNSSGQVSVVYTAPTTTTQISVTISASFAGDSSYQSSSGSSSGTIITLPSTSISISPDNFTLGSSGSTTLIATLMSGGSPISGKTISWSATSGSVSPSSTTTNSSGQVTVTYLAPAATTQTPVTITASFAGTANYQSSSGSSSGTITPIESGQTILSVSPLIFTLYPGYSGQVQALVTTLRSSAYNPLAGKTITWSATAGSVSPSSATTDVLGQATVTYTAPTVTAETSPVTITASFAGDSQYNSSAGTSSGAPAVPVSENIPASTGGTVVINIIEINITVNVLAVPPNALPEDTTITVAETPPENVDDYTMVSEIFDVGPSGISFTTPSTLTIPYDENELPEGVDEDDLAIYCRTGPKSWERVGGNVDKEANTVSVEIDHLSEYAVMAQLPTQPVVAAPLPIWVIAAAALALVIGVTAVIWRHLRESRGDATSLLIEHGLPNMRIVEVEVVREIINMGEFTIPEIMERTGFSKILVWRTVNKLMEKGLVEPTEEVKPPAAGRGKPSIVFKYVGD